MRVHAFDTHLGEQILDVGMSAHAGCFPTLPRAIHDCTANTMFCFSHVPRAQRQEWYDFSCTCETCSLPHATVKNSDARQSDQGYGAG